MDFANLNPAVVIWSFLALVVFNIIVVLWFAVRKADKQATASGGARQGGAFGRCLCHVRALRA